MNVENMKSSWTLYTIGMLLWLTLIALAYIPCSSRTGLACLLRGEREPGVGCKTDPAEPQE